MLWAGVSGHDAGLMNGTGIQKTAKIDCVLYVRFMTAETVKTEARKSAQIETPTMDKTPVNIG